MKEISLRRDYLEGELVETVYFGGGTPSLLETEEIERILHALRSQFLLDAGAEITLEANPDDFDINPVRLRAWRQAGINRLSIGVQSFFEEDLRWMNRAHTASQALDCIRQAREEGFDNLSIDLIYGGPTLPDLHWMENVERAIGLGVPHLSCYALTVEPRTALDALIRRHETADVSPEDQARQFVLLMDWMAAAGYEHYEISNFALPGHRSRHNSAYWQGKKYLGLGPSAHSYDGVSREWNIANNTKYIGEPGLVGEKEVLTAEQRLNEYIMISLRTVEGIDLRVMAERFGGELTEDLRRRAEKWVLGAKLRFAGESLQLTREGKLLADGIAADLFI